MKPEELHPTAAGLCDDDGRSAYQPGKRRHTSTQARHDQPPPTRLIPSYNTARWAAWRGEQTPEQKRDHWRAVARKRRQSHRCPDCGATCSGLGSGRCIACGKRLAARKATNQVLQRQLRERYRGGRSPQHEARVSALAADQLRLPL